MPEYPPVCDQFKHAEGGNWLWCASCGWRWDLHNDPAGKQWAQRRGIPTERVVTCSHCGHRWPTTTRPTECPRCREPIEEAA